MNNLEKVRQVTLLSAAAVLWVGAALADLSDDFVPLPDDPAIEYATRPTYDPIFDPERRDRGRQRAPGV